MTREGVHFLSGAMGGSVLGFVLGFALIGYLLKTVLITRWLEWRIWGRFRELGDLRAVPQWDRSSAWPEEVEGVWIWDVPTIAAYWLPVLRGRRRKVHAILTSSYLRIYGWPDRLPVELKRASRAELVSTLRWELLHRSLEPCQPLRSRMLSIQDPSRV